MKMIAGGRGRMMNASLQHTAHIAAKNNEPTRAAAVFAIAAAMLLSPFAANGTERTPAERP
jgi:hypothetical protein